ncbi:hypothetical protein T484DRAFT_1765686 [Baffinella frigidus]|nr:hypothetical protein T484DRAFT_1765686 [Cryptophyta sp. CCMP2293]
MGLGLRVSLVAVLLPSFASAFVAPALSRLALGQHLTCGVRPRRVGVWVAPRASESGEADQETRRLKYERLFKELVMKGSKLPPEALGYKNTDKIGEGEIEGGAGDEGEGGAGGGGGAPARPSQYEVAEIDIMEATPAFGDELTQVVNWAYRGNRGVQGWTGEMELLDGIRIAPYDMLMLLEKSQLEQDGLKVFVAYMEGEGVIGCVKVERVSADEAEIGMFSVDPSNQSERVSADEAEIGMFSVDPSNQSRGVGKLLLNQAENYAKKSLKAKTASMMGYAKKSLKAKTASMMVLDVREDLIAWYVKRGYVGTGEKMEFPKDANVGKPKRELQFEKYERAL